jgi:hypothetical protein
MNSIQRDYCSAKPSFALKRSLFKETEMVLNIQIAPVTTGSHKTHAPVSAKGLNSAAPQHLDCGEDQTDAVSIWDASSDFPPPQGKGNKLNIFRVHIVDIQDDSE